MRFTSDINAYFDKTSQSFIDYDVLTQEYVPLKNLLYVVDFGDESVYTRSNLQLLQKLTGAAWDTPYAVDVESLVNTQYTYTFLGAFRVESLFGSELDLKSNIIERRKAYASSDPLIVNRLVSSSEAVAGIYLHIDQGGHSNIEALLETMDYAKQLQADFESQYPKINIRLSGETSLELGLYEVFMYDLTTLFPLVILFGLFIFWFLLRSIAIVLSVLIVVGATLLFTSGILGYFQIEFNQTSVMAAISVFIVVTAQMMHLSVSFLSRLRDGVDKQEAIIESFNRNSYPVFLTCITTITGFLFLNGAGSPVFSLMGNVSAIGIAIGFIFAISLLPTLWRLIPIDIGSDKFGIENRLGSIARFVAHRPRQIMALGLIVFIFSMLMIPRNQFNNDAINYFPEDHPLRKASKFTSDHLINRQQLVFSLDGGKPGAANTEAYLAQLGRFHIWLEEQPQSTRVYSFSQLHKKLNAALTNNSDTYSEGALPQSNEEAAQNLLLFEMSLEDSFVVQRFINGPRSASRLIVVTRYLDNEAMLAFRQGCQTWLSENWTDVQVDVSSHDILFAELGKSITRSMLIASLVTVIVIALILGIGFSSWRFGILSLVPNIFPSLVVYGMWGLFVGEVDMAVAVTFCIALGIIVDDTVHILNRYRIEISKGCSPEVAIHHALTKTGSALLMTTLILVGGELIVAQSFYSVHATIAYVVGSTIAVALLFDFLFLPSLLILLSHHRSGLTDKHPAITPQPKKTGAKINIQTIAEKNTSTVSKADTF